MVSPFRFLLPLLAVPLFLQPLLGEEQWWEAQWTAPELPENASPTWIYHRGGTLTPDEEENLLRITSDVPDSTTCYSISSASGYWSPGAEGVTVEFEMRVNRQEGDHACGVQLAGLGPAGNRTCGVLIGSDWVRFPGGAQAAIEPERFNRFRLVVTDREAALYLNDDSSPAITTTEFLENEGSHLFFGDISGHGGGESDWKFVRWSDKGAFTP